MTHADILAKPSMNKKPATLGFGNMRFPPCEDEVVRMTDEYLNAGFNFFDTAYAYEGSEEMLKKVLVSRYPRDAYMLADKIPTWSIKSRSKCDTVFDEILSRLGVDYIDFLVIHSLDENNERNAQKADMYRWAAEQKAKGKAKHVGFSFHGGTALLEQLLTDHPEMEFVYLQLNYIDVLRGQAGQWHQATLKHDIPIIVMEPVKGGMLAKLPPAAEALMKAHAPAASIASWAVRYAATLDGVTNLLSGMSSMEQMRDNIKTFKPLMPLCKMEMGIVEDALNELSKISTVPCTACKYCLADCPQKIDIPSCLNLYNEVKRGGTKWNLQMLYDAIPKQNSAQACNHCGICNDRCPQKIDIPKEFKEVIKMFG